MKISEINFRSEASVREYVGHCEEDFERRLSRTADAVSLIDGLKLIGLCGPTCSGKTTAAKKLISTLDKWGKKAHFISIDDFFINQSLSKVKNSVGNEDSIDFDSVKAIDLEAFCKCVSEIEHGENLTLPIFDFTTREISGYREIRYAPEDVFIFEGIQVLYPEIWNELKRYRCVFVFIAPMKAIRCGEQEFLPNDVRLLRRLVRDSLFRGTNAEETFMLWKSVRANEEKNIFPYVGKCNYIIDSTVGYEINVLKPFLEDVLGKMPKESKYFSESSSISEKIRDIEPIDRSYIPKNSIYTEFIG